MITWYARNDVPYSGGEKQLSITFPYIKKEHIKVFVNDVETTEYHFLNESQIFLDCELTTGDMMSVRRNTPIDEQIVTFTDTSILNAEKQNLAQKQLFNTVQEIYDNNEVFKQDTNEILIDNKQEILNLQSEFEDEVNTKIEMVSSAAEKINQLEDAVDTAVTAANTATEQAEIVEQANINIQNVLAETEAVLQEAKDTLDDALNKSQISNCLLEVPQNIKLELADGVLTLKAGSKVYVPNGFEADGTTPKFDEVTIESDLTRTEGIPNGTCIFFVDDTILHVQKNTKVVSGSTVPSTTTPLWYDTSNNIIKYYNGSSWVTDIGTGKFSLPVAICTTRSNYVNSIDQTFNGFGYIGSTVFVTKGVKGLIPNGINEDGTLKNIEWSNNSVKTCQTHDARITEPYIDIETDELKVSTTCFDDMYDKETNYFIYNGNKFLPLVLGSFYTAAGTKLISNFQPKLPVKLVQYDEFTELKQNTLNTQQITNCIKEVPQRIKYTLENGTLTIKAGSVVIVPYGTEDLTADYPVGSIFINNNFKVYDTQFADGKFFVWAELVGDISNIRTSTDTNERPLYVNLSVNTINAMANSSSGTQDILTGNQYIYRTDLNICHQIGNSTLSTDVVSLPIARVVADGTNLYGSITQVFNGMGYIGSIKWLDTDVIGLATNDRNADGSLNNIQWKTNSILLKDVGTSGSAEYIDIYTTDGLWYNTLSYIVSNTAPALKTSYWWYNPLTNEHFRCDGTNWVKMNATVVGYTSKVDGKVDSFQPKQPFHAVDHNELQEVHCVVETYQNGTSWYRVWSDGWCEQGGEGGNKSGTVQLLKNFVNTNYNITSTATSSGATSAYGLNVTLKRTGAFDYYNATGNFMWRACGYIS